MQRRAQSLQNAFFRSESSPCRGESVAAGRLPALRASMDGRGKMPLGSTGMDGRETAGLQAGAEEKIVPVSLREIQGRCVPARSGKSREGRLCRRRRGFLQNWGASWRDSAIGRTFLEQPDDLPGKQDCDQRPRHAVQRDIAQREQEYEHIGEEVGPAYVPAREVRGRHGEGVVAARGSASPNAEPYAHAHEGRACEGGCARVGGQRRPERREELAQGVGQREAAAGHGGIEDEVAPQYAPAYEVAQGVHHKAGPRGRYAQPVLEQERRAQYAAFRDPCERMDIVQAEGEYGRTDEVQQAFAP